MSILSLIAAFGGGTFGAALGALPAFIMTGFVALAGAGIALAGGPDALVGNLAFGSFFGPHIAFAGGVAAAAYAGRKSVTSKTGQLVSGDTVTLVEEDTFNGSDITFAYCRVNFWSNRIFNKLFICECNRLANRYSSYDCCNIWYISKTNHGQNWIIR